MPWHITNNKQECSGWAVVKDATEEIVGCHTTQGEAQDQLAALHIAEADRTMMDAWDFGMSKKISQDSSNK